MAFTQDKEYLTKCVFVIKLFSSNYVSENIFTFGIQNLTVYRISTSFINIYYLLQRFFPKSLSTRSNGTLFTSSFLQAICKHVIPIRYRSFLPICVFSFEVQNKYKSIMSIVRKKVASLSLRISNTINSQSMNLALVELEILWLSK